mmetsp:Transcript_3461/g.10716  ORF Transcript_3461/g.10716 Transcript_3461/m.10716 type:complete len:375 (+) Transcript_3461:128-1252(+)
MAPTSAMRRRRRALAPQNRGLDAYDSTPEAPAKTTRCDLPTRDSPDARNWASPEASPDATPDATPESSPEFVKKQLVKEVESPDATPPEPAAFASPMFAMSPPPSDEKAPPTPPPAERFDEDIAASFTETEASPFAEKTEASPLADTEMTEVSPFAEKMEVEASPLTEKASPTSIDEYLVPTTPASNASSASSRRVSFALADEIVPPSDVPTEWDRLVASLADSAPVRAVAFVEAATGMARAHLATVAIALPFFLAAWRGAALFAVGGAYPLALAARAAADDKPAATLDRKNLLVYWLLTAASLWCRSTLGFGLLPPLFSIKMATLVYLVHFRGAGAVFDFALKSYFRPVEETCTAIVKTAKKVRRRLSCRYSP